MPRSPVLPEGISVDDLLKLAAGRGGELHPGRYRVVEFEGSGARSCKGLLGAVRCALKLLRSYTDYDELPFELVVGDEHFDDPYFDEILEKHPDARFVIGWSAMAPMQDMAVAVLALPPPLELRNVDRRLLDACAAGDLRRARAAMAAGANPGVWDDAGFSALHHAVAVRSESLVKALLAAKAPPDQPRSALFVKPGRSKPTHGATRIDDQVHETLILMLLDAGADPRARSPHGQTVGDLALRGGRDLGPFIARGAVPSAALGEAPLLEAVETFHGCYGKPKAALALVRALVQCGVDPHETRPEGNPLHALFDPGYDANETDLRVLEAIVRALLEHGVDEAENQDGCTPGDLALTWDYPGIHACFSRFTSHGAAAAAIYGRLDALRRLAFLGVPLDEPDPNWRGYTPLHHAIEHGHAEVAAFLLEQGANPDRKTQGWKKPKRPPASARELAAKSKQAAIRALFSKRKG